jgi:hypothetical protein
MGDLDDTAVVVASPSFSCRLIFLHFLGCLRWRGIRKSNFINGITCLDAADFIYFLSYGPLLMITSQNICCSARSDFHRLSYWHIWCILGSSSAIFVFLWNWSNQIPPHEDPLFGKLKPKKNLDKRLKRYLSSLAKSSNICLLLILELYRPLVLNLTSVCSFSFIWSFRERRNQLIIQRKEEPETAMLLCS